LNFSLSNSVVSCDTIRYDTLELSINKLTNNQFNLADESATEKNRKERSAKTVIYRRYLVWKGCPAGLRQSKAGKVYETGACCGLFSYQAYSYYGYSSNKVSAGFKTNLGLMLQQLRHVD